MEWHRSEPREVRPFFSVQKAEEALAHSGIRLTTQGSISTDTSFEIDELDYQQLEPTLFPTVVNPQMWIPEGMAPSDFELLVLARQPLLKRSMLVARHSLVSSIPEQIELSSDLLKQLGGGRNTQFTVAIVLAEDKVPAPGSPFVQGHWVAKKTFSFRTRSNPVLFDIRPRSDDEWLASGYPAKTLYAVEYMAGIESGPEEGVTSVAVVYVHSDSHQRMVDTKLGDAVQPLLAAEIVTSILQQSYSDWENLDVPPKGSALETLFKQLSKVDETLSIKQLADMVKVNSPKVRALVQSRLSVVQSLK